MRNFLLMAIGHDLQHLFRYDGRLQLGKFDSLDYFVE